MATDAAQNKIKESNKKHILIVDEDEGTRFQLTTELARISKYQVLAAPTVAKALDQISRNPPNLLITSLFLSSSDVVQLVVRTRVLYPNVKVAGIYNSKTCLQKDLQLQRNIMNKLGVLVDFDLSQLTPELCQQLIGLADGEPVDSQSLHTVVNNSDKNGEAEATLADSMPTKVVQR